MTPTYKLSPSDFAFLWEECKRCFYLKHISAFKRPGGPFPTIFGAIDSAMRKRFMGRRTEDMSPDLPPGTMTLGEKWVQSEPITLPGRTASVTIRGKFDAAVQFDDGSFGLIDFKTSAIKPRSIRLYSRQLRAYAYALEHPAPGKLSLGGPLSKMGLLAFTPRSFATDTPSKATLNGAMQFYEIKRNEESFLSFVDEVLAVLDLPAPPDPDPKCQWCQYRAASRENGL